ncbi:phytoene/squalene synthase family protein [Chelativorans salis]|uniref:Phytoene/squalene synthase family protein n=1 Tax=Chelativorans salis TaxID=2978478 RepID=A0ABT2LLA5_9HYPH|nr:phytoene/squalene synthase family protein [Chelativorans sp. EGI FJ00035]MCT7375345.1 phytoene/squalene synthase family protein [Chelativorans sp. EGI FJ00035]
MSPAETEALAIVRQADPDRYLATLYAPVARRGALFSLYAFNAEIGAVRDRISQPLPGEVRLQWWRDVLAAGDPEAAGGHPVTTALIETIRAHRLPAATFENMLEARIFDLYDDPMPSRTDLEGYCGETASALIQLCALVLDVEAAGRTAALAGHAGCAQAIAGLLRLLPIHRRRGQCYIPLDMLQAVGTTREALIAGEDREGAARAVAAMTALGREHLAAFREGAGALPGSLRPAYLPVALAGAYLDRIERGAVDPLEDIAAISPMRRHWLLLSHAMRGW